MEELVVFLQPREIPTAEDLKYLVVASKSPFPYSAPKFAFTAPAFNAVILIHTNFKHECRSTSCKNKQRASYYCVIAYSHRFRSQNYSLNTAKKEIFICYI